MRYVGSNLPASCLLGTIVAVAQGTGSFPSYNPNGLIVATEPHHGDLPNWKIGIADLKQVNLEIGKSGTREKKLAIEFRERADRWEMESAIHSSPSATYLYKDYLAIISIGMNNKNVIVPLILDRLSRSGADWFFALENITGENPAQHAEDFESAHRAWHNWAKQNGLAKEHNEVLAA